MLEKLLFVFFSPINQSFIGAGDVSVTKLEEQRENSFSSPHHKGTPESSVSQQVHILLYLMRQMTFCSKATTFSLGQYADCLPQREPCKLVKCKCSPLLWLLVAVHNLDNIVARRPLRPNPVSGDKQGIQPGAQLHSRGLSTKCWPVLLEEFLPRAQPGTDCEPELTSLYITWS